MADIILLSRRPVEDVLPSLGLLAHRVRVLPPTSSSLAAANGPDALVIDGTLLYNVRSRDDYSVDVLRLSRAATDSGWRARFVTSLTDPLKATTPPCQVQEPEIWFADTPTGVEHAKSLCGRCPLATDCLLGAMERREPWGVWGGELFEQGRVVPRKRTRGRPRKYPSPPQHPEGRRRA